MISTAVLGEFVHQVSGDVIQIPLSPEGRSKYRFRCVCRGLDRLAKDLGLVRYMLTATLSDDWLTEQSNKYIVKLSDWLRHRFNRAGVAFEYVWCVELQRKRYAKHGKAALHWHQVILCSDGALPHVEKRRGVGLAVVEDGSVISNSDIVKRWGKGLIFVQRAKSPTVYGYLSKYFEKDYATVRGFKPEWASLRRWGSSSLRQYAWPDWAFDWSKDCAEEIPGVAQHGRWHKQGKRVQCVAPGLFEGDWTIARSARSPWRFARFVGEGP